MIRFEILLPLYYNDGRPVEPDRFTQTDDELVEQFGATTSETVGIRGRWRYHSVVYEDRLIRMTVDAADEPSNWEFMRALKEELKLRFDQIDIYITAERIEVI